ncbi:MAG: hypothetical protein AB7S41_01770 [Parvibaculaceae bacterium]
MACVVIFVGLSACNMLQETISGGNPAANKIFENANQAIEGRNEDALRDLFAPETIDENFDAKLKAILELLPEGEVVARERADYRAGSFTSLLGQTARETYSTAYQYQYPNGWALISMAASGEAGTLKLTGMNVTRIGGDLRQLNSFWRNGDTPWHWAFLLATLFVTLFILATLAVIVWRRKNIRRPWLWFGFALFGVGILGLNWSTGDLSYALLGIQMLGAGMSRGSEFMPWILKVGLPIGAIIFWIRYPQILAGRGRPKRSTP